MIRTTHQLVILFATLLALLGSSRVEVQAQGREKNPPPPEIQRLYRQIESAWNNRQPAVIGRYLAPKVDLVLPGTRGRYGKIQATQILQRHFSRIQIRKFQVVQMRPTYARAVHEYVLRGSLQRRSVFLRIVRLDRRWLIDRIEEF